MTSGPRRAPLKELKISKGQELCYLLSRPLWSPTATYSITATPCNSGGNGGEEGQQLQEASLAVGSQRRHQGPAGACYFQESFTSRPIFPPLCPGRPAFFPGGPLPLDTSFPLCSAKAQSLPSCSVPTLFLAPITTEHISEHLSIYLVTCSKSVPPVRNLPSQRTGPCSHVATVSPWCT